MKLHFCTHRRHKEEPRRRTPDPGAPGGGGARAAAPSLPASLGSSPALPPGARALQDGRRAGLGAGPPAASPAKAPGRARTTNKALSSPSSLSGKFSPRPTGCKTSLPGNAGPLPLAPAPPRSCGCAADGAARARPRTSAAGGRAGGRASSRVMPQGWAGPVSPPLLPTATMSRRPNMSVRLCVAAVTS